MRLTAPNTWAATGFSAPTVPLRLVLLTGERLVGAGGSMRPYDSRNVGAASCRRHRAAIVGAFFKPISLPAKFCGRH